VLAYDVFAGGVVDYLDNQFGAFILEGENVLMLRSEG
jgi:hypothetical protein